MLQCFLGWCLWVRQSRLSFETWVETMGAMARTRLQDGRAGALVGPSTVASAKSSSLGQGQSWSLSLQQGEADPSTPALSQP